VIYHDIYRKEVLRSVPPNCSATAEAKRFEGSEVYVRRDPATGDVILSRRPESWEDFFELMKSIDVPSDFLAERDDTPPQKRKLL
jgi:antitoxin VapB